MTENNYPGVSDRVKAVVTDSFIIIFLLFVASYIFSYFEDVPTIVRIIAFIFVIILYDPLMTSVFGGTIGHMMFGIRVKRESNQTKNIIFPFAIIRFIAKGFLGWISLLTVHSNEKRKAIHDYVVGSVVVYKKSDQRESNPDESDISE